MESAWIILFCLRFGMMPFFGFLLCLRYVIRNSSFISGLDVVLKFITNMVIALQKWPNSTHIFFFVFFSNYYWNPFGTNLLVLELNKIIVINYGSWNFREILLQLINTWRICFHKYIYQLLSLSSVIIIGCPDL